MVWEENDRAKGVIHFNLDASSLDDRLQPFRAAGLYTMRYAMGEPWTSHWFMHRVFSSRAEQYPHMLAYTGWYEAHAPDEKLTYKELDCVTSLLSLQVARLLPQPLPLMPVAVLYLKRGAPLVASIIASMKCHVAMVVVEDTAPISRLFFVLEDTNAFVLLTTRELHSKIKDALEEASLNATAAATGEAKSETFHLDSHLKIKYIDEAYVESLESVLTGCKRDHSYNVPTNIASSNVSIPPLYEHTVMCIIYTSGSTGRPKGVMLEYGGFTNYAAIEQVVTAMRPGDHVLQTQSLSFVAGFHEVWRPLLCGGTLYFSTSKAVPMLGPDLARWIDQHGINIFKAVPSLLRTLIVKKKQAAGSGNLEPVLMPSLRICHIGGEPITPELVEYFAAPHRNFLNTYGSTETSSNCSIGQCFPNQPVTIGMALPTFHAHILKDGKAADIGELFIGGKSLARGYLNLPEANKKFQNVDNLGRVFSTGDLVEYIEGTKNIKFCGRSDRQIKINGYRLELDEVEIAIRKLLIVKEAVVVFKDSILIAFVQPHLEVPYDAFLPTALKPLLQKEGLPYYAIPTQIRLIQEFPRTVTGKLDNTQLFSVPVLNASTASRDEDPLTATERVIARLFEEMLVLPFESVGRKGNFFEMGGDSGKAGLAISKLRQVDDTHFANVAVSDLYAAPTVGGLAAIIDEKLNQGLAPKEELIRKLPDPIGTPRRYLTAFIQLIVGLLLMIIDSLYIFTGYLYFYPFANRVVNQIRVHGLITVRLEGQLLILFPIMLMAWYSLYHIFACVLLVLSKWLLIGRYKEGRYCLYGSFHIRHWIVERLNRRIRWSTLYGNPAIRYFLGILGAKIGSHFFVKMPDHSPPCGYDLLDFGDDVSINYAYVSPISYTADAIVCGRIKLSHGSTILPRATVLGPAVMDGRLKYVNILTHLGTIGGGDRNELKITEDVPLNSWATGAPARILSNPSLEERHEMDLSDIKDLAPSLHGCNLGSSLYSLLDLLILTVEGYLSCFIVVAPQALLIRYLPPNIGAVRYALHPLVLLISMGIGMVVLPGFLCFLAIRCSPSKKSHYNLFSFPALLIHYKQKWFSGPQMLLNNTLFMNSWMKLCGVTMGTHVELSQIKGLPDMISIGKDSFLANFTHVAVPHACAGRLVVGPVQIGEKCLVGNNACLPINSVLHDMSVLGVLSAPPINANANEPKIWIGNPPVSLPRGRDVPVPRLNLVWHFKRLLGDLLLSATPSIWWCMLLALHIVLLYYLSISDVFMTFSWVELESAGSQTEISDWLMVPAVITGCRFLLGFTAAWISLYWWSPRNNTSTDYRYTSNFIFKWRHYNKTWSMFIRPALVSPFEGSVWMNVIYRLTTKVKIGRWAILCTDTCFRDHNFVEIGDYSVINEEVIFRTHTFEDWKLKFERVEVGSRCVIRPSTILMCGAKIGDFAVVDANTLVMKNEFIKEGAIVRGVPAKTIDYLRYSNRMKVVSNPHCMGAKDFHHHEKASLLDDSKKVDPASRKLK